MKLHILGETPQDKGSQLEKLTGILLESKGYKNIVVRKISTGGLEIDVSGEFDIPNVSTSQIVQLISECKAHMNPIGMTDWLKFLGKVYVEEAATRAQVNGCFIALNGVNGNVRGAYEQLVANGRNNIEIVSGEQLYNLILNTFPVSSFQEIRDYIDLQFTRTIADISLGYYDNKVYWIVEFYGDKFCILNSDGSSLERSGSEENTPVDLQVYTIANELFAGTYIDLKDEKEKQELVTLIQKCIAVALLKKEGSLDRQGLLNETAVLILGYTRENMALQDFDDAHQELCKTIFISCSNDITELDLSTETKKIEMYRFLLNQGFLPPIVLRTELYKNCINESFLVEVSKIQYGVVIPQEEVANCLMILRASPSALTVVINEIQLLVNSRKSNPEYFENNDWLNEAQSKILLRLIYETFERDFNLPSQVMATIMYEEAGIHKVSVDFEITLTGENNVVLATHKNNRTMELGQASEELGGGIMPLIPLYQ